MARPALIDKLMQPAKWLFKKELIPLDDIAGSGLKKISDKLNVDFSEMPAAQLRQMVLAMILNNGGLAVDNNGKLYVDFSQMGTDRFDAMIEEFRKSLRLPLWLTKSIIFYVNKNHAQAADSLIEGRGSANLPFVSIQAVVNYVCDNFNLGKFNITIDIAPGTYEESVTLGDFTTNTGSILLQGADTGTGPLTSIVKTTNNYCFRVSGKNSWRMKNLKLHGILNADADRYKSLIITDAGSTLSLDRFSAQIDYIGDTSGKAHRPFSIAGILNLHNTCAKNSAIVVNNYSAGMECLWRVSGNILMQGGTESANQIECQGAASVFMNVAGGSFARNITHAYPMTFSGPSFQGKRYSVRGGGKCDVAGAGPNFFPGDVAGSVDANTFSWYA